MRPKICVSVKADSVEELERKAKRALEAGGDLVELRIDYLPNSAWGEVADLVMELADKAIVTVRPRWEGGRFTGDEEERMGLLDYLAGLGPAYVDVELQTLRKRPGLAGQARRIVSWHVLDHTPREDQLSRTVSEMLEFGGVSKVVTRVERFEDGLRLLRLFKLYPPERLIAFGVGAYGAFSRILSMIAGSPIVYSCLPGEEVAPGQPTLGEMLELVTILEEKGLWR